MRAEQIHLVLDTLSLGISLQALVIVACFMWLVHTDCRARQFGNRFQFALGVAVTFVGVAALRGSGVIVPAWSLTRQSLLAQEMPLLTLFPIIVFTIGCALLLRIALAHLGKTWLWTAGIIYGLSSACAIILREYPIPIGYYSSETASWLLLLSMN